MENSSLFETFKYALLIKENGEFLEISQPPIDGQHFSFNELQKLIPHKVDCHECWAGDISGWWDTPANWRRRFDLLWLIDEFGRFHGLKPNKFFPRIYGDILIVRKQFVKDLVKKRK